jgi:glucosamine-6-phosphate deaminase
LKILGLKKIHNVLFAAEASIIVAREIADLIKAKQQKENVLGLATGSSPYNGL